MHRNRKNAGFTMAELLIVIGILAALAALSFVGIISYMRSMTKLEYDGYAKEIFIAAQNRLTMAKSQNYLGRSSTGDPDEGTTSVYHVVGGADSKIGGNVSTGLLSVMLPFGSIDESIRAGGSYIIRYDQETAQVLDVFYWDKKGRYPFNYSTDSDDAKAQYNKLVANSGNKEVLKNYSDDYGNSGSVIGWYGGDNINIGESVDGLLKPTITINNAEKLEVVITDNCDSALLNSLSDYKIRLLITGATSKAQTTVTYTIISSATDQKDVINPYSKTHTLVLDDITSTDEHFQQQYGVSEFTGKGDSAANATYAFIPGEDLEIQAIASGSKTDEANNTITVYKEAESTTKKTNSLFDSISVDDEGKYTAYIKNIRHLENLDNDVSGLTAGSTVNAKTKAMNIVKAEQTADLDWSTFKTETGKEKITLVSSSAAVLNNSFYPVFMKEADVTGNSGLSSYDGNGNTISNIIVNNPGKNAGLFASLKDGDTVDNLILESFNISGGNAGALAGATTGDATVTNVLAIDGTSASSVTGSGNAGGLIGEIASGTKVSKCAAAVVVSSTGGNAGGLIGAASDGTITACYSGGHTSEGDYKKVKNGTAIAYNVTSTAEVTETNEGLVGNAGGLVGSAGSATISYSYSTCSVSGTATAGGFVGTASGSIQDCYATGLVDMTKLGNQDTSFGAFAGIYGGTVDENHKCYYFEIVNEYDNNGVYGYLGAVANAAKDNITALDASASVYDTFVGSTWNAAVPYDSTLATYYQGKYNLQTVKQLIGTASGDGIPTIADTDYVVSHYGDWPAPEIFVINQ